MAYSGPVFSFEHNWKSPVVERLAWLTNILPRKSDTEQRICLRKYPRRTLEYRPLVSDRAMRAAFDAFMELYQSDLILIPIWADAEKLTAQVNSGSTTVSLTTTNKDYDADAYVLFQRDYATYEAIQLDSISGGLTLSEATTTTWPIGTKIMPARLGYLGDEIKGAQIIRDVRDESVVFEIPQTVPSVNRFVAATPPQFQIDFNPIMDYVDLRSESSSDRAFDSVARRVHNDYETGAVSISKRSDIAINKLEFRQLMDDRDEIAVFLNFLSRRRGRQVPFWTPAYEQRFDVVDESPFTIADELYKERFDAGIARRYIVRAYAAGDTPKIHRVGSVTKDSGNEIPDLVRNWDVTLAATRALPVTCPLRYCRLEADAIELSWLTSDVVDTRFTVRELFAEVPLT